MVGHDQGFLYHHWLLAQLPWDATISTNFDSFHERAGLHASSTRDSVPKANKILRRHAFAATEATGKTDGLFKPYGSLVSPVNLALSYQSVEAQRAALTRTFDATMPTARKGGTIVILGHRLVDATLRDALAARSENYRIYWIIPEPVEQVLDASYTAWQIAVSNRKVVKLDGEALEFAFDLYSEFRVHAEEPQ
jgi:hypothetical protein